MTLQELIAHLGTEQDVLRFYCWHDAQLQADAWSDDPVGMADILQGWFEKGMQPVDMQEVVQWLAEWNNPDAIGGTDEELLELIAQFKR